MSNFYFGIVCEVKPGYAKVNFEADGIVSDWLPVVRRKSKSDLESWQLEIDEHVACLMDCHLEDGVILGAIHSDADAPDSAESAGKFRKKFSDGTVIEYDKNAHELTVDVKGSIKAKASMTAEIEALSAEVKATASITLNAPMVTIQGAATITGALTAASISTGGMTLTGGGGVSGTGDIQTSGTIQGGSIKAGLIDLASHKHTAPPGGGATGPALP